MKTLFNTVLRAGVAALAFAGASHAADSLRIDTLGGTVVTTSSGGNFGGLTTLTGLTVPLWDITYNSNDFLAFCIAPTIHMNNTAPGYATYTVNTAFVAIDSEKRLFEKYFGNINSNRSSGLYTPTSNAASFQLALWELRNDNGNLGTGLLAFNLGLGANSVVTGAKTMLDFALNTNNVILNTYSYTSFESAESQTLLTATAASAVPEVDSWAMLLAGLGVLGFMCRRKAA